MARRTPSSSGPTVLEVLQRPNPPLTDRWAGSSYANTRSSTESFDYVTVAKPWTDFTFEAISLAYGDLLNMSIKSFQPGYIPPANLTQTPSVIVHEGSVDRVGLDWSRPILRVPIKAAASVLGTRFSPTGGNSDPSFIDKPIKWKNPADTTVTFVPDWAILEYNLPILIRYREDHSSEGEKPLVYVIGDSKLKQKWKAAWLALKDGETKIEMDKRYGSTQKNVRDVKLERMLPLHQVASYCRYAQTRYAFIITQMELVALRIRRVPRVPGIDAHCAAVEYVAIPWEATTGLTVNLAIWALGCMGMNDEHREMEAVSPRNSPLRSMARLTWWRHDGTTGDYENVISKRRIPAAQWKKEYDSFVHTSEKAGNSYTTNFLGDPKAKVTAPSDPSVDAVTQKLRAMSVGKGPSTQPAGSASKPSTTAAPTEGAAAPKPATAKPATAKPANAPTAKPATAKPATAKPAPSKPAPDKPRSAPAPPNAPGPATAAKSASAFKPGSKPSPKPATVSSHQATRSCFIKGKKFTAVYSTSNRWTVLFGGQDLEIHREGRRHIVVFNGDALEVKFGDDPN